MTEKPPDRRVRRTRQLLHEALIELILEKGYEAVTVQDIIDRADVGRSTFYAHFLDKQQLLMSGLEQLRQFLAQQQRTARTGSSHLGEPTLGFSLAMFQHAQSHHRVFRAMVGRQSGAIVQQQIQRILADLVREEMAPLLPRGAAAPIPLDVVVEYTVNAFLGLLTWWLDQDTPCSPEEMDRMFRALTLPGISAATPGSSVI